MTQLTCERARELVLMDLAPADDVSAARRHLLECPACASETAGDVADSAARAVARHTDPTSLVRRALFVMSLLQTIIAIPWIFGVAFLWVGDSADSVAHITRDGVIGFVIGMVGILVAVRPALAYFAVSVCVIQVGIQVVTIGFDVIDNDVSPTFEMLHLLAVIITVLVARVAFPGKR